MFERLASVDGVFAAGMAVAAGSPLPVCCGVVWCGVVWCGVVCGGVVVVGGHTRPELLPFS
jgi:hypothetical protein